MADPAVSEAKFAWELGHFLESEAAYRRKGILLLRATFPEVLIAFATPRLRPAPVAFGARFDYTDYDHSPPSVCLVDPFTERPFTEKELPLHLLRRTVAIAEEPGSRRPYNGSLVPLVQTRTGSPPYVCIPGTRDYHEHPGHCSDSWLVCRASDVGSLGSLVMQLFAHAVRSLEGYELKPPAVSTESASPSSGRLSEPRSSSSR